MDQNLKRAIEDSQLLMAFLGRAQLVLESEEDRKKFDEHAFAIAKAQAAVSANTPLSDLDTAAFWKSFIFLSNLGSPATIESIRYYFDYYQCEPSRWWNRLLRTVKGRTPASGRARYSYVTFAVLGLTLFLSLIGFVGSRTLAQYAADSRHWNALVNVARLGSYNQKIEASFDKDGKTLLIGTRQKAAVAERPSQIASARPMAIDLRDGTGAIQPALFQPLVEIPSDRVLRLRAALPRLLDTDADLNGLVWHPSCKGAEPCVKAAHVLLAEEFVFTLAGLQTERRILETLLWPVTASYRFFVPEINPPSIALPSIPERCAIKEPFPQLDPAGDRLVQIGALMEEPLVLNRIFLTILCNDLPMPINLPPPLRSMITMEFKADLALNVLNAYVLTLLFGLLGSCVHVIRDINRRLDDFTLTRGLLNRYWARLILGGVSGAFIGLFFNPAGELLGVSGAAAAAATLTSQLTGVTLAFVAGFSVEVLFAILDRITQIFREFAYGADAARTMGPRVGSLTRQVRVQ